MLIGRIFIMAARGWKQDRIARKLGIEQSRVSRITTFAYFRRRNVHKVSGADKNDLM